MNSINSLAKTIKPSNLQYLKLYGWIGWGMLLTSTTAIAAVYILLANQKLQVVCHSDGEPCSDAYTTTINEALPHSLLFFNQSHINNALVKQFPELATPITFAFMPPSTITTTLSTRKPVALVSFPTSVVPRAYSLEGVPIPLSTHQPALSQIKFLYSPSIESGGIITSQADRNILLFVHEATTQGIFFSTVNVATAFEAHLSLNGSYWVIANPSQPHTRQLTTLQLILSQATMNPQLPVIDVRYTQPVLKPISALGAAQF